MYYEFIVLVVQYIFIWRVNWRQRKVWRAKTWSFIWTI